MKRPEFLMIVLLRSSLLSSFSSAFATTSSSLSSSQSAVSVAASTALSAVTTAGAASATSSSGHIRGQQQQQQVVPQTLIRLRLATRTDVSAISRCNLACLPENYNHQFYCSHLRQWPELALVAEAVETFPPSSSSPSSSTAAYDHRQQMRGSNSMFRPSNSMYSPSSSSSYSSHNDVQDRYYYANNGEPKIVAYVLGKVEARPVIDYRNDFPPPSPFDQTNSDMELVGHVTSLAVQREYRRFGIARALMEQLQCHMQHYGGGGGAGGNVATAATTAAGRRRRVNPSAVSSCGLHVRVSNHAACRLYQDDGYEVESVLPHYYQDGEEAYYMRKFLPPPQPPQTHQYRSSSYSPFDNPLLFGSKKKIWRHGPEHVRLPRIHCSVVEDHLDMNDIDNDCHSNNNNEELLTGSM